MPTLENHETGQRRIAESAVTLMTDMGFFDPRELQFDAAGWGFYPHTAPPYYRQSQKRGEVLPVYISESQLSLIRDRSRKLCAENEFAICAVENRRSYVVGDGFTYTAVGRGAGVAKRDVAAVQRVIDLFIEVNELQSVESDTMLRLDRDGEAFLRFFPRSSGIVDIRFIEAEHVRSPLGDSYSAATSFGVETNPSDIEDVKGYWVVDDPLHNPTPEFVPAKEVLHVKLNTDRSAKRGLPTFYPVEGNLRRVEDLLASLSSMAKARAKIALIRKLDGPTQSGPQAMLDSLTEAQASDPVTGASISMERMRYGTILTSSGNVEYQFPSPDTGATDYVAVLQAELRAVAARLVMPEWMLTVDASNANYSSSLIAEAPSTKTFSRLQSMLARRFGECRYAGRESVVWRQLRHCVRRGILPASILRDVDIQVDPPSLIVRDHAAEASTNMQYLQARIKSPQTIAAEQGLDFDAEQQNFAAASMPTIGEAVTEGCVPNRSGSGHHDDKTGHPCKDGGGASAARKSLTAPPAHPHVAAAARIVRGQSKAHQDVAEGNEALLAKHLSRALGEKVTALPDNEAFDATGTMRIC